MRTTVDLEDDVVAAIDQMRRGGSVGLSEAVNQLIRAGLLQTPRVRRFRQRSAPLGLRVDVSNVAEALETLDGAGGR
ncbi:MAG: ribbon-helix-helix protein, CopG family [Candidatus Dormibacteria bacterium]|jgi:metal-responsive CopG/Arc/MetJ family transcriptional regulator